MSSTAYPYVTWQKIKAVKVGMCESEVESILDAALQYYNHPVNAIVFTDHPTRGSAEVALKLSDALCIEDISYKFQNAP
jgi:hypothetical protein